MRCWIEQSVPLNERVDGKTPAEVKADRLARVAKSCLEEIERRASGRVLARKDGEDGRKDD